MNRLFVTPGKSAGAEELDGAGLYSELCFARIRFQRRHIKLPLFERDWQSLKSGLRQHSLPKVQFATKTLPKDFSTCSERRMPYLPVK